MIKRFLQWLGIMKKPKPEIKVPESVNKQLDDMQRKWENGMKDAKIREALENTTIYAGTRSSVSKSFSSPPSSSRVNSSGSAYSSPHVQRDDSSDGFINGAVTGYAFNSMMNSSHAASSHVSSPSPAPSRSDSDCSSYSYSSYDSSSSSCDSSSSSSDW